MPKLFWKQRNEEVLHISRPSTRDDSPSHSIFQYQDESSPVGNGHKFRRGRETHSQDYLDNVPNLDDSLGHLRAQLSKHPGREVRERERETLQKEFTGYQFPDDITRRDLLIKNPPNINVLLNGSIVSNVGALPSQSRDLRGYPNGSGFESDIDDDITKMAAQRDQQRGTTKFNRGMMAPITSTNEDTHRITASNRMGMIKQRSDSVLDMSDDSSIGPSVIERRNMYYEGMPPHISIPEPHPIQKMRHVGDGVGLGRRNPNENYLEEFNSRDIMAQSMRRQSLRGSRVNLSENTQDEDAYGRYKIGTKSPNNFKVFPSVNKPYERDYERQPSYAIEMPNNHDDVQILNLQGFMDSSMRGHTAASNKSRRNHVKRMEDSSPVDGRRAGRSRRKKKSKSLSKGNSTGLDESDEVVLKDIDDIDEKMASLVVGPKQQFKNSVGRPITFDEAVRLRRILTGNASVSLPKEWLEQSFIQNKNLNLSYGLIQKKGGPCGVLASVQAHLLKSLIFGSRLSPSMSPASPLRPSTKEWAWALAVGITEILWRIKESSKVVLALPGSLASHFDYGLGRYVPDGLTETLTLYEYTTEDSLLSAVQNHQQVFTTTASSGCVLLLYSALLTRGLETVAVDMDQGGGYLINAHGYASQEVVNLLLTGEATTNTFNGEQTFGNEGLLPNKFSIETAMENFENKLKNNEMNDKMVLRGIKERSDIGLLSLFEHYGSCKVGSYLKSPEFPVWVICSESHYSVAFAREQYAARDDPPQDVFDIYYYDGLALQEDEIRLTVDLGKEPKHADLVPPLELCLRTKWPQAHISWNGSEPIL